MKIINGENRNWKNWLKIYSNIHQINNIFINKK
jgi:hypothetical protein